MSTGQSILAAIVSYNCDDVILENVNSLKSQVNKILILDNHSTDVSSIQRLHQLASDAQCEVMFGTENLGISARLNEALAYAEKNGYPLLLTMDQDTVLCMDCVSHMLQVMQQNPKIASVGPNRKTEESENGYHIATYLITSGNLVDVKAARACGGYMTDLFIDMVDIEFSLALRKQGYLIAIADSAKMKHAVGVDEKVVVLGHEIHYLSHSALRFYYIYRNHVIVTRMYLKNQTKFCTKMNLVLCADTLKMFLEHDRFKKMKMAAKGIKDGVKYRLREMNRNSSNF